MPEFMIMASLQLKDTMKENNLTISQDLNKCEEKMGAKPPFFFLEKSHNTIYL